MEIKKKSYLTCKDFTVSNEEFELIYNSKFEMLETSPQPKLDKLASYYESPTYISHTDSKKTLIDKIYQLVKKRTLQNKLKLINSFKTSEKNILDVGCGTGDFLFTCKSNGWSVIGVEPNLKAKSLAEIKLSNSNSNPIVSKLEELEDIKFDVITLWHVLEHVPNLERYISNLKSLLKPNGTLVVAVPNFKSYDARYYKKFWAAYDVPRHLWHFSRKSIQLLFENENMKVDSILPMKFDSFYVALLSEKYKYKKSNFLSAFCVGLLSNIKASVSKEYSSLIYIIKNC